MQILHLLQQPALSFFIQRTVGKAGNALFTVRKSSQALQKLSYTFMIYL